MSTTVSESIGAETFKYWAFITYSHRDKKWGDWLHRALETYRIPKRIVGQPTRNGPRPKRLFPIFRDREELAASADLSTEVNQALVQSCYLVVVCSPNSAKSVWVNEEIKFFKKLGREDRVLALIVAGEPNASNGKSRSTTEEECFPEALRYLIDSGGQVLPLRAEPIAGDAREGKDGKTNAKLKLIAGLLDTSFDTLKQREQERRRRSLLQLTAGAILIAVAMGLIAVYAVDQERRAVSARQNAEDILNYLLYQLGGKLQPIGRLDIIEDVQKKVESYYKNLGFSNRDPTAQNNWATLLESEGDRLLLQGDLNGAKAKYQAGLEIEQRLVTQIPGDRTWSYNLSLTTSRLGDVLQAQGDLNGASAQYTAELDIMQRLTKDDPGNKQWQRDLSVSHEKLGDVLQAKGDFSGAKAQYNSALQIMQKLVSEDPGNARWQRDLSVAYVKLGDMLKREGDLSGAKAQYNSAFETSQKLVKQDPSNSQFQRDLSFGYQKLGDVLVTERDFSGAKTQYTGAFEISQRLANQDPGNSQWQRDLMVNHSKLADLSLVQGDLQNAKTEYNTVLGIGKKLAQQDPGNTEWQRDLSLCYEKLGIALTDEGDFNSAEAACTSSLQIRQKLSSEDPGNSQWRRDLSLAYYNLAIVLKAQGYAKNAEANFRSSLEILNDLIRTHGENALWRTDLGRVKKQLGE